MLLTEETKKDYTGIGILIEKKDDGERKYVGDYIDGKEHGIGMYQARGGRHNYAGQFNKGNANGIGVKMWTHDTGQQLYCGQFENNMRHGQGYYKLSTGASFLGEFKNHEPNGFGVMITWEGLKFIGHVDSWLAVSINGILQGKWYNQKDTEIDITKLGYDFDGTKYVGNVTDGKYHKYGIEISPGGNKYVGEWKNCMPNGWGQNFEYTNGWLYTGEFKDGYRHGYGTCANGDGRKYVGNWKNGKMHGLGTLTLVNGLKYKGEFKDDIADGPGTYIHHNGNIHAGEWKAGEFI